MATVPSDQDFAWQHIHAALGRVSTIARNAGFAWKGESCGYVSHLALLLIMWNRNLMPGMSRKWKVDGGGPVSCDSNDPHLAYADHYLDRRTHCGFGMGRARAQIQAYGYFGVKTLAPYGSPGVAPFLTAVDPPLGAMAQASYAITKLKQENTCKPFSAPSHMMLGWASRGIQDGIADYSQNPENQANGPAWYREALGNARILLPPQCLPLLAKL